MNEEAPTATTAAVPNGPPTNKVAAQFKKLKDANEKYKDLLKMAKERIKQQEEELKRLRAESEEQKEKLESEERDAANMMGMGDGDGIIGDSADQICNIVQVCQRIRVDLDPEERNMKGGSEEYWVLVEFEFYNPDQPEFMPAKRTKKWKRFDTESDVQDFVRRDTGEPLVLPPYSLTPQQSAQIQEEAQKTVEQITNDFRKYRVKAEMLRKQSEQHIRELQNNNVERTKQRIEGNLDLELPNLRNGVAGGAASNAAHQAEIERLKTELTNQEAHWKKAYDMLLSENENLKATGSEALLASQWRSRYETCMKEKDELANKLKAEKERGNDAEGKYEAKYRDLKESFRLYRKKAKEIFEAQSSGEPALARLTDESGAEAKLDYLRNLMVNYLTSEAEVRDHMEIAIGTVLNFTTEDRDKIEKKKKDDEYWNIF